METAELRTKIEEAIKTTLVIENKTSLHFATDKIMDIINNR
jgi:hypothetical protein